MRTTFFALAIILLGITYTSSLALAQNKPGNQQQSNNPANTGAGTPSTGGAKTILQFDRPAQDSFPQLFNRFISIMLALSATLATIFIIVGGFQLALSRGNAESATAGRKTITWAFIGLVVALMAFAIVRFADQLVFK